MEKKIEYYKVKSANGRFLSFIATESRKAAISFLNEYFNGNTCCSWDCDEHKLMEITKEEASETEYFKFFSVDYELCLDGTFLLEERRLVS